MNAIGALHASQARVRLGIAFTLAGIACTVGAGYAAYPAGTTNAVLSLIDAAGSHVSVNRHWPRSPEDVQMYPFTPYLWNSCLPGDGAIILLVTGPGYQPPIGTSAEDYTRQYLASLGRTIAASLAGVPQARGGSDLRTIIVGMTTPGNPAYETLKEGILWVNSLDYYESYGYAVFLVIHWKWVFPLPGCYTDMVMVPEGYGIPFVAHHRSGRTEASSEQGLVGSSLTGPPAGGASVSGVGPLVAHSRPRHHSGVHRRPTRFSPQNTEQAPLPAVSLRRDLGVATEEALEYFWAKTRITSGIEQLPSN